MDATSCFDGLQPDNARSELAGSRADQKQDQGLERDVEENQRDATVHVGIQPYGMPRDLPKTERRAGKCVMDLACKEDPMALLRQA
jgi:hypothetical protein